MPKQAKCKSITGSPLTQGRGLKHDDRITNDIICPVAPHAGAWIETKPCIPIQTLARRSPLTQGRGLKRAHGKPRARMDSSPLTQGRGLKQQTEP